jgi:hypothetical protein
MQPEQPTNTPSTDVQPSDAAVAETSSDEQREGSSPGWWSRMFHRGGSEEAQAASEDAKAADSASQTLKLTQEELERRIQSETDRREAKRAQEAKIAERRKLRDEDPWAYAEQERQDEQIQDQSVGVQQFFSNIGTAHDRVSIDPLVEILPKEERDRIMNLDGAGTGLEGRKLVVKESLKALEKHWRAEGAKDAESKLRRNQAFRKQIFAELRGGVTEPDLLPASSSSAADQTVSAILRERYGFKS